ncbi:hypothetical protein B0H14DRAFT_2597017 [Mycena olivaceomarginata]|nr:hypothetical protein B0H14DRAFT_2597017 [Mycena olivaceomarginata]
MCSRGVRRGSSRGLHCGGMSVVTVAVAGPDGARVVGRLRGFVGGPCHSMNLGFCDIPARVVWKKKESRFAALVAAVKAELEPGSFKDQRQMREDEEGEEGGQAIGWSKRGKDAASLCFRLFILTSVTRIPKQLVQDPHFKHIQNFQLSIGTSYELHVYRPVATQIPCFDVDFFEDTHSQGNAQFTNFQAKPVFRRLFTSFASIFELRKNCFGLSVKERVSVRIFFLDSGKSGPARDGASGNLWTSQNSMGKTRYEVNLSGTKLTQEIHLILRKHEIGHFIEPPTFTDRKANYTGDYIWELGATLNIENQLLVQVLSGPEMSQATVRIGSSWSREELLLWDERRREAILAPAAPPSPRSIDIRHQQRSLHAAVGWADGEMVERPWREMGPGSRRAPLIGDERGEVIAAQVADRHRPPPWAGMSREEIDEARQALAGNPSPDSDDSEDEGPPPLSPMDVIAPTAPAGGILETGARVLRTYLLTEDELYKGPERPTPLTSDRSHQVCSICLHVKSHPVSGVLGSYRCGHSHCYVCIRRWLQLDWRCPVCKTVMCEALFRHYGEQDGLAVDFPGWKNTSKSPTALPA